MTFPTITIPDPAAVGKWLDEQLPAVDPHRVNYLHSGRLITCHWLTPGACIDGIGDTPEAILADIRRQLADNDPLAKLRKEWIAAGRPNLD